MLYLEFLHMNMMTEIHFVILAMSMRRLNQSYQFVFPKEIFL